MIFKILQNFLFQIFYSVGIIVLFAVAIHYLNKLFHRLLGRYGAKAQIATGIVGTPVHELGHAVFCLIFGHKIIEMKLFSPDTRTGTLGYVRHSYKKNNLYHRIGSFFIGVGPILFGSAVLLLLMFIFVPKTLSSLTETMKSFSLLNFNIFSKESYIYTGEILGKIITSVFSADNLINPFWWIFLILSSSIALHLSISPADIKSSATGFVFIVLILLIVDTVLYLISYDLLLSATKYVITFSSFVINFLLISILMSLVLVALAALIGGIIKLSKFKR